MGKKQCRSFHADISIFSNVYRYIDILKCVSIYSGKKLENIRKGGYCTLLDFSFFFVNSIVFCNQNSDRLEMINQARQIKSTLTFRKKTRSCQTCFI